MNDLDLLEGLIERRGRLLDSATGMLVAVSAQGRRFTARKLDAWDWASAKADEFAGQIDALAGSLAARRYWPRPSFTERVPR
jgi:hypothetical protein